MEIKLRPSIGVGVIIRKDGKVLLGKRKGSWSFPGGHLEFGESIEACAIRETKEETGLQIKNIQKGCFTNDIFSEEDKQYVTLFMVADYKGGEVQLLEPEKCEIWEWFDWNSLPKPYFLPLENLLKEKFNPFHL